MFFINSQLVQVKGPPGMVTESRICEHLCHNGCYAGLLWVEFLLDEMSHLTAIYFMLPFSHEDDFDWPEEELVTNDYIISWIW